MSVEYVYAINAVRVKSEGELVNVVKEVDVTITGSDGAASFTLPTTVLFHAVDPEHFTPYEELTEAQIVSWVESAQSVEGTKAHIAYVVAREIEKLSMEQKPLPWAPAPEPTPEPESAE